MKKGNSLSISCFFFLLYIDEFMYSLEFYFGLMQLGFVFFLFMIVKCYIIAYKDSLQ